MLLLLLTALVAAASARGYGSVSYVTGNSAAVNDVTRNGVQPVHGKRETTSVACVELSVKCPSRDRTFERLSVMCPKV